VLVTVRYFAGAAAAAGLEEEKLDVPSGTTLGGLLAQVASARPAVEPVLTVASLLVDEVATRDRDAHLPEGATVDGLPPFAGG
jgi:molybdopterin converting factor small subunit